MQQLYDDEHEGIPRPPRAGATPVGSAAAGLRPSEHPEGIRQREPRIPPCVPQVGVARRSARVEG